MGECTSSLAGVFAGSEFHSQTGNLDRELYDQLHGSQLQQIASAKNQILSFCRPVLQLQANLPQSLGGLDAAVCVGLCALVGL